MKILVINLGWEQELLIKELYRENHELYGVHNNNDYIQSVNFKEIKICDFRDLDSILSFAKDIGIEAVISDNCDYSLLAQSFVADVLNLPSPSLKAGQISNNKYLQRKILSEANIKTPKYLLCLTSDDVRGFAKINGYPIITKPVDNRGSFGVIKINSEDEIDSAFSYSIVNSNSNLILAEEFIIGKQITIDGYGFKKAGVKSLAIGDKILKKEDGEVATTISYPSILPIDIQKKALLLNEKINTIFDYKFGMTHSEYMIRDDDVYLIESTNRGGGVFTSSIIASYSSDIDLVKQYIFDITSADRELYSSPKSLNIVLKFFRFKNGIVKDIIGFEKILNNPNVIVSTLNIKKGDIIKNITNDANRHGFMIYKGSEEDAEKLMNIVRLNQT